MPGRIALVGSGEYLPVMQDVEAWLLENRPPKFVQFATAAAPEGEQSLNYWRNLGAAAAERLNVEQVFVDVHDEVSANDPRLAELVRGAGAIYFSGGNPAFLARTLAGSRVLQAVIDEWKSGASIAGCSAGAMALGANVPSLRNPRHGGTSGFGVVQSIRVLPHFDRYSSWIPNFAAQLLVAESLITVGIDEETALIAEPSADSVWNFTVAGNQKVWVISADGKQEISELPLAIAI